MTTPVRDIKTRFEHATPILRVNDLGMALNYYVGVLGFRGADWGTRLFTMVSRDGADIYLCQRGQGAPGTWLWVGVDDVGALFQEYQASGAKIRLPPGNYPWAYEMHVEDTDGHVIRFGSEPRRDLPIAEATF